VTPLTLPAHGMATYSSRLKTLIRRGDIQTALIRWMLSMSIGRCSWPHLFRPTPVEVPTLSGDEESIGLVYNVSFPLLYFYRQSEAGRYAATIATPPYAATETGLGLRLPAFRIHLEGTSCATPRKRLNQTLSLPLRVPAALGLSLRGHLEGTSWPHAA